MNIQHRLARDEPQGQATFGMANLRMEKTGLPFIVFIPQRGGARHDVRVKVSPEPKLRVDQMSSYALRPCRLVEGPGLSPADEQRLQQWVDLNVDTLVAYWDGIIEFTEDAIEQLKPV